MTADFETDPSCWSCRARHAAARVDATTVLRGRPAREGGPYRVFRCPACGTENGVLNGPRSSPAARLLHPLSGLEPPSLLERILSPAERTRLERSRVWWRQHREAVERFRRGEAERPRAADAAARRVPRAAPTGDRAVLGVSAAARPDEIHRAFRRLAKRLHPDRAVREGIPADEAAARFRELRAAYERLVGR